jgi:hypothetical protein
MAEATKPEFRPRGARVRRFYSSRSPGYWEVSVVVFGRVFQLTRWYGPPRSVYAGLELHWWRYGGGDPS